MNNGRQAEPLHSNYVDKHLEEAILLPYTYAMEVTSKTKSILAKLCIAFNYWIKLPEEQFNKFETILETLHTSYYITHNIQRNFNFRENSPTATLVFGTPSTLNAVYYEFFVLLEKLLEFQKPEMFQLFVKYSLEIERGRGMELYWNENFICPKEDDYIQMVVRKRSSAMLFAVRVMQLFSKNTYNFSTLAQKLGVFTQIYEDYINLKIENDDHTIEDITGDEENFSFPIIHAVNVNPENSQLTNLFKKRNQNEEIRKYCIAELKKCESFQYTKQKLVQLKNEIISELSQFEKNPYMLQILECISKKLEI